MKFTIENDHIKGDLGFGEIFISTNEENGYRPFELFISSLVGCSGSLLQILLTKRRFSFQNIEVEVCSVRNPDHANRIEQLCLTALVQSEDSFTPQQAEKIAHVVVKNCGMIQSVISSIDFTFTIQSIPLNGGP